MNQNTSDPEWQQLQSRIDKLFGQFLKDNLPAIEYKTSIAGLLQLPPMYNEQNSEEIL